MAFHWFQSLRHWSLSCKTSLVAKKRERGLHLQATNQMHHCLNIVILYTKSGPMSIWLFYDSSNGNKTSKQVSLLGIWFFVFCVSHLRFFTCCHGRRNGIKKCVSGLKAKIEPCQTQQAWSCCLWLLTESPWRKNLSMFINYCNILLKSHMLNLNCVNPTAVKRVLNVN